MNLQIKKTGEVVLLSPLKQLDTTTTTEFKARVVDLINQGSNFFLLNLSQVDFVDSSGLGAMISILKTLTLNNGDIVLCNLNSSVLNLFNLTRMNSVFKICSNEEEGLKFLAESRKKLSAKRI